LIRTAPENHLLGGKHQMYRVGLCKSHFVFISEDLFKLHILSKCKACIFLHLPSPKNYACKKPTQEYMGVGGGWKREWAWHWEPTALTDWSKSSKRSLFVFILPLALTLDFGFHFQLLLFAFYSTSRWFAVQMK